MSQILFYFTFLVGGREKKRFPLRWIYTLCSCSEGTRVSKSNQLETFYTVPFMSPEEHYQSVFTVFISISHCFLLERSFGGKVPLEITRFSHTLLNLPQTFVKELKGINWRNSSVERFTWDTSVIFANQSYRHNSVCTLRPWGSTAPQSVCNTLKTLEEDKRIVFSHGI